MKRRYKWLGGFVVLCAVIVGSLMLYLSQDGGCRTAEPLAANATRMSAMVYRCYGGPDVVKLDSIAKPAPKEDQVLVRVQVAAVNPLDWHYVRGKPYIMRGEVGVGVPTDIRIGTDFSGVVEAVGAKVTRFKPGDAVFGGADGAFADYVVVGENRSLAAKPANVSFEQAAALPIAAVTALQALRDKGQVKAGQKVLINGASGGVGTYAVQIAKSLGAEVTGVCSGRNVAMVQGLGADHVIDYTQQNFTNGTEKYDVIIDTVGNHPLGALRGVLVPAGIVVIVGGPNDGDFLGALSGAIKAAIYSKFVSQRFEFMLASLNKDDLGLLAEMMQGGKLKSVIDRRYALGEVPAALTYLEGGRARGKVVVTVSEPSAPVQAAAP